MKMESLLMIFILLLFGKEVNAQDCVYAWVDDPRQVCDGGVRTELLFVIDRAVGDGEPCPTDTSRDKTCDENPCPVDCVVVWVDDPNSECSAHCGGGLKTQLPFIVTPAVGSGMACPTGPREAPCNEDPCPECACESDIIFLVELGSYVGDTELVNIKDYLKRFLQRIADYDHGDCYRTALVTYSDSATVEYGFDSGSIEDMQGVIDGMTAGGPGHNLQSAFEEAFNLFEEDTNPSRTGCRNVILIAGDASDDTEGAVDEAEHLYLGTISRLLIVEITDREPSDQSQCGREEEFADLLGRFNDPLDDSIVVSRETFSCCKASDDSIKALQDAICDNCGEECRCDVQGSILIPCNGGKIDLASRGDASRNVLLQDEDFEIEMRIATSSASSSVVIRSDSDLGSGQELVFDDTSLQLGSLDLSGTRHVAIDKLSIISDEPATASKIKGKWVYKETSNGVKVTHKVKARFAASATTTQGDEDDEDAPVVVQSKGRASGLCTGSTSSNVIS